MSLSPSLWNRLYRRGRTLGSRPSLRRPRQLRTHWTRRPLFLEELESRIVLTLPLPGPINPVPVLLPAPLVPGPGDQQILNLVNDLGHNVFSRDLFDNLNVPVPYVILASANGAPPTVTVGHAGTPVDLDAHGSLFGCCAPDIQVEVQDYMEPTPHLELIVDRLNNAPVAHNLSVLIAFPFAGFDLEPGLPSTPNLVMGFQTRAAGNTPGGSAPLQEVIDLTPGTLAGTSHSFQATMTTTKASNPLSFILGNLDGTNRTGTLNAAVLRTYVENVPATINLNFATTESALGTPINSSFALNWQATCATLVQMDYLEYLTNPATASGPDFNTSLMANPMPTKEQFSLALNESAGTLNLSQNANAGISQMTFQKTRSDGLAIVGNASNVPTQVNLTLNLAGSATLTDNANVGSLAVQASKTSGFAGSSGFLGYNVGTIGFAVTAAPSLTAGYDASGASRTFTAAPAVAGNVINDLEFIVSSNPPAAVQLPTRWSNQAWDIFSMVDTGTGDTSVPPVFGPGATAATRLLNLLAANFTLNTAPLGSSFDLKTTTPTPLQSYLRTTPTSKLTPGHDDEITCEIVNVPAGETQFYFNGPTSFGYTTVPATSINSVHCFGHIDALAFDNDAGGLPAVFSFLFDPDSMMQIVAQDGHGGNALVGHLAVLLADSNGISLFADAGTLLGQKLEEARMRVDNTPTFTGTWVADNASGNTAINFNTVAPGLFAAGVQFAVSTKFNDPALANPLTPASMLTADYASFNDQGAGARNMLVGMLGIDSFSYGVTNASDMVNIVWDDDQPVPFNLNVASISGGVYFAGNHVNLNNYIALVPSHLDYMTNLDPMVCYTGTNLIPSINLTFGKNVGLPTGTSLTVQLDNLPAVLCFDFEAAAGTLTVIAQNADLSPATIGDVIFDLEAPNGLPLTGGLLGAPIEQARLRLDSVPSFTASWNTTGSGTSFGFMATPPGFFLGGAQLELGTLVDLPIPSPATATSIDYVNFLDKGGSGEKQAAVGLFGISQFSVSTASAGTGLTLNYVDNAARELQVNVASNFGQFYPLDNVQATLDIQDIPQTFDFSTDFATMLNYTASSPISSITATADLDPTTNPHDDTHVEFMAQGLPAMVDFVLDPNTSATLSMSDAITQLMFSATSDDTILGTGTYKLVQADLNNIPANWNVNWSGGQFVMQAMDASNNPAPMGLVTATVSTSDSPSDNAAFLMPFQTSGPGGARINYSPYLQAIDDRYFSLGTGAPVTLAEIQNIYNNAQVLEAGEDYAVAQVNGGSLAFFDGQFTGFQKIVYQPNSNGGHFEFDAPTPGPHPFLAGIGLDSNFLIGHIDNIPSSATLDINLATDNIHFHSSASAGTIDVYYGPQGMAQDSDTALRAVMQNTPTDVNITWGFGFPNGSASFVASNPFTLLFLAQNGSNRLVGGFRLQELDVNYGMDILPLNVNINTTLLVPTSLTVGLFDAHAGINVGASGVPVDGFFNLYTMKSSPDALNPAGPTPGANEYIPELTFMMQNFTEFTFNLSVGLGITILPVPFIITPSVSASVSVTGQFIFDVWQNSDINDTLFGVIGYVDAADYSDNTPIQLLPFNTIVIQNHGGLTFSFEGFSDLSDHFDPLA